MSMWERTSAGMSSSVSIMHLVRRCVSSRLITLTAAYHTTRLRKSQMLVSQEWLTFRDMMKEKKADGQ